jgi:nitrate reductase gamma subunit
VIEQWLEWARGPLFRLAFLIMILGLARLVILTGLGIFRAWYRANDRKLPVKALIMATLKWLFPFKQLHNRLAYSIASVLFHVGLILTPIFLGAHIMLWKRGIGIGWPGLTHGLADALTILTVVAGIGLIIGRAANRSSRAISRPQDFALPPLLIIPFISGLLAMHPALNPMSYNAAMLIHTLSADLIFVLIPFTKMAHCVLLPATQLVAELGWHFPADQGENVAIALGKESQPV